MTSFSRHLEPGSNTELKITLLRKTAQSTDRKKQQQQCFVSQNMGNNELKMSERYRFD